MSTSKIEHVGTVPPLVLCAAIHAACLRFVPKEGSSCDVSSGSVPTWQRDAAKIGVTLQAESKEQDVSWKEKDAFGWIQVLHKIFETYLDPNQPRECIPTEERWIQHAMVELVSGGKLQASIQLLDEELQASIEEKELKREGSTLEKKVWILRESDTYGPADVATWAQLTNMPQWKAMKKRGVAPKNVMDICERLEQEIPGLVDLAREHEAASKPPSLKKKTMESGDKSSTDSGKAKVKSTGAFVDLPGAEEGKVITRFPPEPSGYLHIGHAKAALLNNYFAERYHGKMLVRFDDTNPSKEKDEFVENIIQDMRTLGLKFDEITYTSDYFDQLMELCERMIHEGKLYADDTPMERMRAERMEGIESVRRDSSIEENLAAWGHMKNGDEVGLNYCIRIKMDMKNPNKALRDPVCYRCNLLFHHRTGSKYKVYPTYDFACPYVDSVEGVTHALRSSEYKDREAQYYWMLKLMDVRKVKIWEFSRLNFVYTLLSKRKLQWFVDTGRVEGWFDPRFPTVQGIVRRGLQVEALKEFILSQGSSKNINNMEWDKLWTMNKKVIDPVCPRHTAVLMQGRIPVHVVDGPEEPEGVVLPRHKKNPDAGTKITTRMKHILIDAEDAACVSEGEEVTLMDWGNCIISHIRQNPAGEVESLEARLNLEGSVKTTKLKLTWLPEMEGLVELKLVYFGYLITKKKLDEGENFEEFVNENSRSEVMALGDPNMASIKKGDVLQLERKGYFICDEPFQGPDKPMVLFDIPDGKQK